MNRGFQIKLGLFLFVFLSMFSRVAVADWDSCKYACPGPTEAFLLQSIPTNQKIAVKDKVYDKVCYCENKEFIKSGSSCFVMSSKGQDKIAIYSGESAAEAANLPAFSNAEKLCREHHNQVIEKYAQKQKAADLANAQKLKEDTAKKVKAEKEKEQKEKLALAKNNADQWGRSANALDKADCDFIEDKLKHQGAGGKDSYFDNNKLSGACNRLHDNEEKFKDCKSNSYYSAHTGECDRVRAKYLDDKKTLEQARDQANKEKDRWLSKAEDPNKKPVVPPKPLSEQSKQDIELAKVGDAKTKMQNAEAKMAKVCAKAQGAECESAARERDAAKENYSKIHDDVKASLTSKNPVKEEQPKIETKSASVDVKKPEPTFEERKQKVSGELNSKKDSLDKDIASLNDQLAKTPDSDAKKSNELYSQIEAKSAERDVVSQDLNNLSGTKADEQDYVVKKYEGMPSYNNGEPQNAQAPQETPQNQTAQANADGSAPGSEKKVDVASAPKEDADFEARVDKAAEASRAAQSGESESGVGSGSADKERWDQVKFGANDECAIGFINGLAKDYSGPRNRKAFAAYVDEHKSEYKSCDSAKTWVGAFNAAEQGTTMLSGISAGVAGGVATANVQEVAQNSQNPMAVIREGYHQQANALKATAWTQIGAAAIHGGVTAGASILAAERGDAAKAADFSGGEEASAVKDDEAYKAEKHSENNKVLTTAGLAHMVTQSAEDPEVSIRSSNAQGGDMSSKAVQTNKEISEEAKATAFQSGMQMVTAAAGAISNFMQASLLEDQAAMLHDVSTQPTSQMAPGEGDYVAPNVAPGGVYGGSTGGTQESAVVASDEAVSGNAPFIPSGGGGGGGGAPGGLKDKPMAAGPLSTIAAGNTTGGGGGGGLSGGALGGGEAEAGEKGEQLVGSAPSKFEGTGGGSGFSSALGGSKRNNDTGAFDMNAMLASLLPKKKEEQKEQGSILDFNGKNKGRAPGSANEDDGSILGPNSNLWARVSKVYVDSLKAGRIR